MDTHSTLAVVAEINIGIAGFSSVAAAIFTRSTEDRFHEYWTELFTLLSASFGGVLLAYLPMVLGSASLDEPTIWFVGSFVYSCWVLANILIQVDSMTKLFKSGGLTAALSLITTLIAFVALTLNIVNATVLRESWPYLAALGCGLLISFIQFGLLIRGLWGAHDKTF